MTSPFSCPSASSLRRLLTETPAAVDQAALVGHLENCSSCQHQLDKLAGANPVLLEAARALQRNTFVNEPPLRRVLDDLGSDANLVTLYRSSESGVWRSSPPRPPVSPELLGALDDYEVAEVLGQGGMGQVFKAFDRALRRWVAIKVLTPSLAGEEVSRLRFAREARAAAAMRHENVITIHAVREANGLPFFVMEYVAGGSLQDYLDRRPPTDWRTVVRLGAEIAAGLAAAHAKGLIHRDIKPSNILLQTEEESEGPGVAKISDFGLARIADESRLTQTGMIAGTPMYMAPEQVQGEPLDHRADLFSLGSVLYTLCTGREPFLGGSPMAVIRQVCEVTPPSIQEVNPAIPPWLAAVVERLHAKRRDDRFTSAGEVVDLLRYNLEHPDLPRGVPPPQAKEHAPRNQSRRRFIAVAAALLLMGSLMLAASLYRTSPLGDGAPDEGRVRERAILRGHTGPVWSVAFSPDGRTLATGSDDTSLRFWNATTGHEEGEQLAHGSAVLAVAFAHSGKFLLSSSGDGAIRLWDVATRKELPTLTHRSSNARRLALSPDDKLAAMGNNTQGVELWDLDTRQLYKTLPGHHGTILSIAFSGDGQTLATGDAQGSIRLWEPATGTERASFSGDALGVRAWSSRRTARRWLRPEPETRT